MSETKNLTEKMPAKVSQFNALIHGFLRDLKAVAPKRNPSYKYNHARERQLGLEEIVAGGDMA